MLLIACSIALCALVTFVLFLDAFIDRGLAWALRLQRWLRPAAYVRQRIKLSQPLRYLDSPGSRPSEPARTVEAKH